jgi:hypothetical protein
MLGVLRRRVNEASVEDLAASGEKSNRAALDGPFGFAQGRQARAAVPTWAFRHSEPLGSGADLARPLHRLPVSLGDVAVVHLKLAGQFSHGFPLSGFLGQHESIERLQRAGPAQQHGLAFLIDGDIVEHLAHADAFGQFYYGPTGLW